MSANRTKDNKVRKFYFLSILCLFPILGIIVGVILSLYAIFKFRSIPLFLTILLMTLGGLVLIKVDSYYLERDLKYGKATENGFVLIAADELDQITKSLQEYKSKYDSYPDSLQQLEKEYPFLSITDPLLGRNSEIHKTINFNYKRTEEGYILFSSGVDGIPNTKDDIYPRTHLK